jgi:TatD DNase family protein
MPVGSQFIGCSSRSIRVVVIIALFVLLPRYNCLTQNCGWLVHHHNKKTLGTALKAAIEEKQMEFCDIGLNLSDGMYKGYYHGHQKHPEDIEAVLRRGVDYGVKKSILTGSTVEASIECIDMCARYSHLCGLFSTVGVHPTHSKDFVGKEEEVIAQLRNLIENDPERRVVALGECGLDYDRLFFANKNLQLRGFDLQLDLSATLSRPLPLFLHSRNTGGDFERIIRENRHKLPRGGVVHSFTGGVEEMRELVDLGLYIGVNGCSMKTEENLAVVKEIPLEWLLLETDAPWCGIKPTHASSKYVKTKFETKKVEKYEPGKMVKDRNEPCTMCQV